MFIVKCRKCGKDFDKDALYATDGLRRWHDEDYCSEYCMKQAHDAYDRYVDPLGFYTSKSIDNYD